MFPAANDLLAMFVGLEVLSLPLYLLCGLARRRRLLSQEAALKYFLLGAFASAFFLYGLALLYGYANTDLLSGIHDAVQTAAQNDSLLYLGLGLLGMGLLFKVGAAPFQVWIPDVYHGAPTPITAFMAAATKVAAFGALLRVLYVGFGPLTWDWRPILWAVAILTMIIGAVFAVTQQDLKRMLAYSSIAHAGFVLVGVIAASSRGLSGSLFYLLTYGVTTVGAFGILALVRDADGEATHLSRWAGLGKRAPLLAGVVTLFLLSLAGIPLTSGFAGKYAVFLAGIDGGATPVVIVALVMSAVTAFFYIRVIVLMYFSDPVAVGPTIVLPGVFTAVALAMAVAVTVVLGVYPDPFLHLARDAVPFVR
jgi:NADH-quinone oxidoreductase subunit N